jgi:hypothetical protein
MRKTEKVFPLVCSSFLLTRAVKITTCLRLPYASFRTHRKGVHTHTHTHNVEVSKMRDFPQKLKRVRSISHKSGSS